MDSCKTYQLLENTDFEFMLLISPEINFLPSQEEASLLKAELLDVSGEYRNESNCENQKLENKLFKHDFILSRSLRFYSSETSGEEVNFNTRIMKCRICEQCLLKKVNKR
ncbi:hypothetical protein NPIL_45921 [Nephila pilipes]|uniref:Uncharacterized protein n=1 Tax=Nephila pilipes TaxID=299642 RepID=A0A8X6MBQ2_NEPPI|nr:hypothetical protein NPIL_45921 [Nephila pilipes]